MRGVRSPLHVAARHHGAVSVAAAWGTVLTGLGLRVHGRRPGPARRGVRSPRHVAARHHGAVARHAGRRGCTLSESVAAA